MFEERKYTDIMYKQKDEERGTCYPCAEFFPQSKVLAILEARLIVQKGDTVLSRWNPTPLQQIELSLYGRPGGTGGGNIENKQWSDIAGEYIQRKNLIYFPESKGYEYMENDDESTN